jgi:hypothetical protein
VGGLSRSPLTADEQTHDAFCGCLEAVPKELADAFAQREIVVKHRIDGMNITSSEPVL